jgi:peroxiredoxin
MDALLLAARLLLAAVFTVAGLAKLADRAGARHAVRDFGVPARLAPVVAAALPALELGVAVALVPAATAWWAAVVGLALLLGFAAAITANLVRGRRPACRCFGEISAGPLGWRTLVRAVLLAAVAAVVTGLGRVDAGPGAFTAFGDLISDPAVLGLFGVLVLGVLTVQGWLLVHLLRQSGRLLLRVEEWDVAGRAGTTAHGLAGLTGPEPARPPRPNGSMPVMGLEVGIPAPSFELVDLDGESMTLDELLAGGRPVVVLFSNPDCQGCAAMYPQVGHWQRDHARDATVVLLSRGDTAVHRALREEHRLTRVLLQDNDDVMDAYKVDATPGAVLVRPDGTIGSRAALGPSAIMELIAQAAHGESSDLGLIPAAPG